MVERLKLEELQSYGELVPSGEVKPRQEQRQSLRKAWLAEAVFVVDGSSLQVRTTDISIGGASIEAAEQLAVGKDGRIAFDLAVDGASAPVAAHVAVIYCFYTGEQGYKVGLEFIELDTRCKDLIARYTSS